MHKLAYTSAIFCIRLSLKETLLRSYLIILMNLCLTFLEHMVTIPCKHYILLGYFKCLMQLLLFCIKKDAKWPVLIS